MESEQYPKVYLYKRIVQAKRFIDDYYAERIDLDAISGEAYFSKFHFVRLFKSIYGKTPRNYLQYVRIVRAKTLLEQGLSIAETCFAVGFESVTSFSGLFAKTGGQPPSEFSANYRKKKQQIMQNPRGYIPRCYGEQHGWFENSNFEEMLSVSDADLSTVK